MGETEGNKGEEEREEALIRETGVIPVTHTEDRVAESLEVTRKARKIPTPESGLADVSGTVDPRKALHASMDEPRKKH